MERTILNKWYRLCSIYVPFAFKTNILESKEVLKGVLEKKSLESHVLLRGHCIGSCRHMWSVRSSRDT